MMVGGDDSVTDSGSKSGSNSGFRSACQMPVVDLHFKWKFQFSACQCQCASGLTVLVAGAYEYRVPRALRLGFLVHSRSVW